MPADEMDCTEVPRRNRRHVVKWCTVVMASVICVVFSVGLGGCWDAHDIDHVGFIMGVGVDESDDGRTTVWVQMALPSATPEGFGQFPAWLGSATGNTMMDAVSILKTKSGKTLFRGHVRVLIIGERIARKGLRPILDFMARDPEFRYNSWVVATSDPLDKIFEVEADQQNVASIYINEMMRHATLSSTAPQSRFRDLITSVEQFGDQLIVARLRLVQAEAEEKGGGEDQKQGIEEGHGTQNGGSEGQGEYGEAKPGKNDLEISGSAAFDGDVLVGWLDPRETAMALMARNKLKEYSFIHTLPGADGVGAGMRVVRSRATIELPPRDEISLPQLSGAEIRIRVIGSVYIEEITSVEQFVSVEAVEELNRGVSQQIEEDMRMMIEVAQQRLGSDILGIGEAVRRRIPHGTWERDIAPAWHDIFKVIRIVPEVRLKVERHGVTMSSPRPRV